MQSISKKAIQLGRWFGAQPRDPRYIFVLAWSVAVFALMTVQALHHGWFDSFEKPVFHFVNNLPGFLSVPMYLITQLGSLGGLVLWLAAAWYLVSRRAACMLAVTGFLAWLDAKIAKAYVHRGRPQAFLHHLHLFHDKLYSGYGFPSGHSTFSAACAAYLYYQVRPRYRKYLLAIVFLVGVSRMYLGAHFPFDVVGGWALGAATGALVALVFGTAPRLLSSSYIKQKLAAHGLPTRSIQALHTDARGSRPLMIIGADGREYFGKLFGPQEHAADWLFKLYRFFRYKNLQAEEPYINARRNMELESFSNLWAKKVGVRVPEIVDLVRIGSHWLLVQERINGQPLTNVKRVRQTTLEDAWRQVRKLHAGNMVHRDLRAANLLVGKGGQVWLIDFGFAEVNPNNRRKYMDVAELLMSMSLVAGADRTITAARKVLGPKALRPVLPYLHKSVFSGATTTALRGNKQVLTDLREGLKKSLNIQEDVKPADITRLNLRKLIVFGLLAAFVYLVLPQFRRFSGNLDALEHWRLGWTVLAVVLSVGTYVAAGAIYVVLANVPIRLRDASIVQLAASFVSKVVPAGLGGTSLNGRYLTRAGLEPAEASAVIAAQNTIGVIMFVVPLAVFLLVAGHSAGELWHFHIAAKVLYIAGTVVVLAVLVLVSSRKIRARAADFAYKLLLNLREVSTSPRELSLAAVCSFVITLCYVGALYACAHAFHGTVTLTQVVVVYASAMIAKTAVPTPGGLGPIEVTMAAGLIDSGMVAAPAYAAVILYRLVTFWLPVPFSFLSYRYIMRRHLI